MATKKRNLGNLGEDAACKWLEARGYSIIERNYLRPWGEIDVVAQKGGKAIFVEVKSVTRESVIRPEENMHRKKLERLHRAIQTYLADRNVPRETSWQVDLLCVRLDMEAKKAKVEQFENVL